MTKLDIEMELFKIVNESFLDTIKREQSCFDEVAENFADAIVLFGAGELGRKTLAGLRLVGVEPLAFSDNNPALWGKIIDGVLVLSPVEATGRYGLSSVFVITIWRAGSSHRMATTRQQLLNLNCNHVVPFGQLFWKYAEHFLPYYAFGLPSVLLKQKDQILNTFGLWADDASRREYLAQIRFRLQLDFDGLSSPVRHQQYFADDLFTIGDDDVVVDCGAFDGDTLRELFIRQPDFAGTVWALEPDPINLKVLHDYVASLDTRMQEHITILPIAVGRRQETLRFAATGTAASLLDPNGALEVDCLPLDEILKESIPSLIKMDIEGAEIDALEGVQNTIKRSLPVLAISVYHQPDHLWRIPQLIRSFSSRYSLFLRPHNEEGWDLVCYAVPVGRLSTNTGVH